jgi:hypothetical protein
MAEAQAVARVDARRWFYHWMALTCLAVSVIGYLPTYFVPMAQGTLSKAPIVHLHGMLLFAWIVYLGTQTWLAASGRVVAHREWGLLGIAIATAMLASLIAINVRILTLGLTNAGPPALLQLTNALFFGTCIVVALMNVRRPETHKRLMLMATISLLGAPIGRWWLIAFGAQINAMIAAGGVPDLPGMLLLSGPSMVASLLIVVAMAFDWSTRRSISLIYAIGLPVFVLMGPLVGPLSLSPVGSAVDGWLKHLGG